MGNTFRRSVHRILNRRRGGVTSTEGLRMIGHNSGEDRYLDSSRVLRELEEAERNHQLDTQGVLDELAKACSYCGKKNIHHQGQADAYMLARSAYFAEAKRRLTLSPTENSLRASSARYGRSDPIAKEGFKPFCERIGVSRALARDLAVVGSASDPVAALKELRGKSRARQQRYHTILRELRDDPLTAIKKVWHKLSPAQRRAFLEWASTNARMSA